MTMQELEEVFGPPISVYTREQAICEGVLIDVTEWAREAGLHAPTVFTQHLWSVVDVDSMKGYAGCQDTRGRAHDVLWMGMLKLAVMNRMGKLRAGPHFYELFLSHGRKKKAVLMIDVDGDGVTIMFPEDR